MRGPRDETSLERWTEVRTSRRGMLRGALGLAAAAAAGTSALETLFEPRPRTVWADDSTPTAVVQWNNAALQALRDTKPGPPMLARALAIVHTCIYDAWTAYDPIAVPTRASGVPKVSSHCRNANRTKAISYAAYRALVDLFPQPAEVATFNALMAGLGFDPTDRSTDTTTPTGIGNVCAQAVIDFRHGDGSNQLGLLGPTGVPYSDYTGYPNAYGPYPAAPTPYNTPTQITNPNEWQPLSVQGVTQQYIGPHWGLVIPFALTSGAQFRPATGPQTTPFGPGTTAATGYVAQAQQILAYSAGLTDTQKMIVEFWRPGTAPTRGNIPRQAAPAPPAMWCQFAQFVSQRDKHDLDDDVKMFFALANALLDAGIACWDAKRFWNSVRPITAVHYLSTVPIASGGFLDPSTNTAPVSAWAGPCQGTHTIDGATWQPYQPASVVTPAFPEYFSGHSTFSAAGAQILASFTGHDTFGGAATFAAGSSTVEPGCTPATDITLSWATFSEAADQAGLSRRYGGIHFQDGDLVGRAVGRQVGMAVWAKAQAYITGRATPGS